MAIEALSQVLLVWLGTAVVMAAGWWVQVRSRNAGLVDALWAACMGASALFYALAGTGDPAERALLVLFAGLWSLRLCAHLVARVRSEDEDGRYRYLRAHWHDSQPKFFVFFQAQALFTALFSLPYLAAANAPGAHAGWWVLAAAIWLTGLGGEALADRQLARYRRQPGSRGHTCRTGLWRYSRHPNYFFEWLHWFAYLALAVGSPLWWLALTGPLLMLASLYWITGIPFTEAQALRSRGDDYRAYQRSTSPFFPWPPKDSRHEP